LQTLAVFLNPNPRNPGELLELAPAGGSLKAPHQGAQVFGSVFDGTRYPRYRTVTYIGADAALRRYADVSCG